MSASNTKYFGNDANRNGIPDSLERRGNDLNGNGIPDSLERKSTDLNRNGIPDSLERRGTDLNGNGIPDVLERRTTTTSDLNGNGIPDYLERGTNSTAFVTQVVLPTKVIEKPAAIHEEIRREQVEEIQPIINVEKLKTEVHQIRQPLVDREVRAVGITETTLPSQILPQINQPNIGAPIASEMSTVNVHQTAQVVQKPAIVNETERVQIIEEIQPVLYKETIVPTLIKETKPIYQTIVEGTTYVQETLPVRELRGTHYTAPVVAPVVMPMVTPTVIPVQTVPTVIPPPVVAPVSRDVVHDSHKPHVKTEVITTTTTTTSNSPYAPF